MRRPDPKLMSVRKATMFSIVTNALIIVLMVLICLYVVLTEVMQLDLPLLRMMVLVTSVMLVLDAAFSIRDALSMRKMLEQIDDMSSTIGDMEALNNTLRAQRHDFLNHLQVVYSLMEMDETQEANAYIEKVYGSITAVSRVMKTANPAINALLQVKLAACEKEHIKVNMNIRSAWKNLSIPGWEMCKVLSNLIDNAIDALREVEERELNLTLTEDLHAFRFVVSNNGPMIPVASQKKVFLPGVTTKSEGHGMGLFIVKKTMNERGGDIELESDNEHTSFSGWIPKEIYVADDQAPQKEP